MKVSARDKQKRKEKILNIAVDLIGEDGYQKVSMRQIAKEAGIGEATIYNYFPAKEKIITYYFENRSALVAQSLEEIPDWQSFSFQEQMQTMLNTYLEFFLNERSFISSVYEPVFLSAAYYGEDVRVAQESFLKIVEQIVMASVEVEELPRSASSPFVVRLFWDYFLSVIRYWIKDSSDNFSNTAALIDKSMALFSALLVSGVYDKGADIVRFLFRTHVAANMGAFFGAINHFNGEKQPFGDAGEKKEKRGKRPRKAKAKQKKAKL